MPIEGEERIIQKSLFAEKAGFGRRENSSHRSQLKNINIKRGTQTPYNSSGLG